MKTTLDLPADLVRKVKRRASRGGRRVAEEVTELLRKGLAASSGTSATTVRATPAMLKRRAKVAGKFLSGEWGVELGEFEGARTAERAASAARARAWRN